jgi:hypothetical protein
VEEFVKEKRAWHKFPPEQRFFIKTDDILSHVDGLNSDKEAPWKDDKARELTATKLGRELREYGVESDLQGKGKGNQARGYWSDEIEKIVQQYRK